MRRRGGRGAERQATFFSTSSSFASVLAGDGATCSALAGTFSSTSQGTNDADIHTPTTFSLVAPIDLKGEELKAQMRVNQLSSKGTGAVSPPRCFNIESRLTPRCLSISERLDNEAIRRGITRQALLKTWIVDKRAGELLSILAVPQTGQGEHQLQRLPALHSEGRRPRRVVRRGSRSGLPGSLLVAAGRVVVRLGVDHQFSRSNSSAFQRPPIYRTRPRYIFLAKRTVRELSPRLSRNLVLVSFCKRSSFRRNERRSYSRL